eukprot:TRINITY_DN7688_c0_g1_i1.p2 TRINITY_DN7688_c0_g1~~TRINITY_DN7688_c0_g1_i1.p2  ORF type:complete len:101 (+),score=26.11 TRINITY_DN7688_c0_g1_i1:166-468(+)
MDVDGDGFINYTEFIAAALGEEIYLNPERMKQAFISLDSNSDGTIETRELRKIFSIKLEHDEVKVWDSIIEKADKNHDGKIDLNEFVAMMYSLKATTKYT